MKKDGTIIYACAGCSGAGQVAYKVALSLDKEGKGKMSCLAGVASAKPYFLKQLTDQKVVVIDGCAMACGKYIFENLQIHIDQHVELHKLGVKKNAIVSEDIVDGLINGIEIDKT